VPHPPARGPGRRTAVAPLPARGRTASQGWLRGPCRRRRALVFLAAGPWLRHQGRRPLPVCPPAAGTGGARRRAPGRLARLAPHPRPAGDPGLAGPQAARQTAGQPHQRPVHG
jgi:hypothetical protein